jgi:endonuclease/exonuclease/phosphatase family metal-dependent hydrolase
MKKSLSRLIRGLILIITGAVLFFAAFLAFMTFSEYHPAAKETLKIQGTGAIAIPSSTLTFMTWNIGYSGLGKNMDFFYEGGKRVRPEREEFDSYYSMIRKLVNENDTMDFIFVQEVDQDSKRSYWQNEVSQISGTKDHYSAFAKNYDCRFVPLPVTAAMGRVKSGILTLSGYRPATAERISYTSSFPWPRRVFFLKRCFMVLTYPLENGKELIVINTHNSTYDIEGELRKTELAELGRFATEEFHKGNYVIAGGDWNNNPPGFSGEAFMDGNLAKNVEPAIDPAFLSGWKFVFDPALPTNRDVDMPYEKGKTKTTIIDFFVISPNIEFVSVKTLETGFACSDHQPVLMKVRLKL